MLAGRWRNGIGAPRGLHRPANAAFCVMSFRGNVQDGGALSPKTLKEGAREPKFRGRAGPRRPVPKQRGHSPGCRVCGLEPSSVRSRRETRGRTVPSPVPTAAPNPGLGGHGRATVTTLSPSESRPPRGSSGSARPGHRQPQCWEATPPAAAPLCRPLDPGSAQGPPAAVDCGGQPGAASRLWQAAGDAGFLCPVGLPASSAAGLLEARWRRGQVRGRGGGFHSMKTRRGASASGSTPRSLSSETGADMS